jgi:hypothetical protein
VLLKQFFHAEADLRAIAEDREVELEERAQEERANDLPPDRPPPEEAPEEE